MPRVIISEAAGGASSASPSSARRSRPLPLVPLFREDSPSPPQPPASASSSSSAAQHSFDPMLAAQTGAMVEAAAARLEAQSPHELEQRHQTRATKAAAASIRAASPAMQQKEQRKSHKKKEKTAQQKTAAAAAAEEPVRSASPALKRSHPKQQAADSTIQLQIQAPKRSYKKKQPQMLQEEENDEEEEEEEEEESPSAAASSRSSRSPSPSLSPSPPPTPRTTRSSGVRIELENDGGTPLSPPDKRCKNHRIQAASAARTSPPPTVSVPVAAAAASSPVAAAASRTVVPVVAASPRVAASPVSKSPAPSAFKAVSSPAAAASSSSPAPLVPKPAAPRIVAPPMPVRGNSGQMQRQPSSAAQPAAAGRPSEAAKIKVPSMPAAAASTPAAAAAAPRVLVPIAAGSSSFVAAPAAAASASASAPRASPSPQPSMRGSAIGAQPISRATSSPVGVGDVLAVVRAAVEKKPPAQVTAEVAAAKRAQLLAQAKALEGKGVPPVERALPEIHEESQFTLVAALEPVSPRSMQCVLISPNEQRLLEEAALLCEQSVTNPFAPLCRLLPRIDERAQEDQDFPRLEADLQSIAPGEAMDDEGEETTGLAKPLPLESGPTLLKLAHQQHYVLDPLLDATARRAQAESESYFARARARIEAVVAAGLEAAIAEVKLEHELAKAKREEAGEDEDHIPQLAAAVQPVVVTPLLLPPVPVAAEAEPAPEPPMAIHAQISEVSSSPPQPNPSPLTPQSPAPKRFRRRIKDDDEDEVEEAEEQKQPEAEAEGEIEEVQDQVMEPQAAASSSPAVAVTSRFAAAPASSAIVAASSSSSGAAAVIPRVPPPAPVRKTTAVIPSWPKGYRYPCHRIPVDCPQDAVTIHTEIYRALAPIWDPLMAAEVATIDDHHLAAWSFTRLMELFRKQNRLAMTHIATGSGQTAAGKLHDASLSAILQRKAQLTFRDLLLLYMCLCISHYLLHCGVRMTQYFVETFLEDPLWLMLLSNSEAISTPKHPSMQLAQSPLKRMEGVMTMLKRMNDRVEDENHRPKYIDSPKLLKIYEILRRTRWMLLWAMRNKKIEIKEREAEKQQQALAAARRNPAARSAVPAAAAATAAAVPADDMLPTWVTLILTPSDESAHMLTIALQEKFGSEYVAVVRPHKALWTADGKETEEAKRVEKEDQDPQTYVRLFRRACLVVGQSSHLLPHPIFPWSCVRAVIHYDATDPDEMEASFDLIIEKWTPTPAFIERVEQGEMHSISLETDVEKTMVLLPPEKREYIRLQPRHPIKVLVSTDFYNANPDLVMTLEDESIGLCKREMDPSMIWDVNTAVLLVDLSEMVQHRVLQMNENAFFDYSRDRVLHLCHGFSSIHVLLFHPDLNAVNYGRAQAVKNRLQTMLAGHMIAQRVLSYIRFAGSIPQLNLEVLKSMRFAEETAVAREESKLNAQVDAMEREIKRLRDQLPQSSDNSLDGTIDDAEIVQKEKEVEEFKKTIPAALQLTADAWYDRRWMHEWNTPHERLLVAAGLNNLAAQMVLMHYRKSPRDFLALTFEEAAQMMPEIPRTQMERALTLAHMQIREPKPPESALQIPADEVADEAAMDDQAPAYPAAASFVAAPVRHTMAPPLASAADQPSVPSSSSLVAHKRSHAAMTSKRHASTEATEDKKEQEEAAPAEESDEVRTPVVHARASPPVMQRQPEIVSYREMQRQRAQRDGIEFPDSRLQSTQSRAVTPPHIESRVALTPRPESRRPDSHSHASSGAVISRHSWSSSSSLGRRRTHMTAAQMLAAEDAGPLLGHTSMRMDRSGKRKGHHEQRELEDETPVAARQRIASISPELSDPEQQQPLLVIPPPRRSAQAAAAAAATPRFSGLEIPPPSPLLPRSSRHQDRDRASFQTHDRLHREHRRAIEQETGYRTVAALGESSDVSHRQSGQRVIQMMRVQPSPLSSGSGPTEVLRPQPQQQYQSRDRPHESSRSARPSASTRDDEGWRHRSTPPAAAAAAAAAPSSLSRGHGLSSRAHSSRPFAATTPSAPHTSSLSRDLPPLHSGGAHSLSSMMMREDYRTRREVDSSDKTAAHNSMMDKYARRR